MIWIYLSPHLDDAVLSCGGLIHKQVRQGDQVAVWTICAGDPPKEPFSDFAQGQHAMWNLDGEAAAARRVEDQQACEALGASWRHFSVPDCIYRRSPDDGRALYASEEAIFGPVDPAEGPLISGLAEDLARGLPAGAQVVIPLGVGGHVDHRLTCHAAGSLPFFLWYYAELPYVNRNSDWMDGASPLQGDPDWESQRFPLGADDLDAWQAGVAAYGSQLPVFWPSTDEMRKGIIDYAGQVGGARIWRRVARGG